MCEGWCDVLLEHKDVSSSPKHSCKKPEMAACVPGTLALYGTDTGGWLRLATLALGSERLCLKGIEQRKIEQCSPLDSTHAHVCSLLHEGTYNIRIHTHTQMK